MLAKFGLILLVILFGACMFVAGTMAPQDWRQSIAALGARVSGITLPSATATGGVKDATKPAAAASTATAATAKPATLDTLIVASSVKTPAPKQGATAYALQLGMYVSDESAAEEEQLVKTSGIQLPLTRVPVLDASGKPWTVVAVGRFPSTAEAQQAAGRIASLLGMRNLSVIRLPAAKPTAKTASGKTPS